MLHIKASNPKRNIVSLGSFVEDKEIDEELNVFNTECLSEEEQELKNVMYFKTDADFENFCIDPTIVPVVYSHNGIDGTAAGFNFTPCYQEAVNNGTKFVICDPNSSIIKHGNVVSYRTISKSSWRYNRCCSKGNIYF